MASVLASAIETRNAGEYDRARKVLERGLLVHPDHPDLLFARAETLSLQGEPSRKAWREFLDAAAEDGEAESERCVRARALLSGPAQSDEG